MGGGQAGCERRIEVFVKIQKKGGVGGLSRGGGSGWGGVRVDVNEELKFLCKFKKKLGEGGRGLKGGGRGRGWGVRLDVIEELKFLGKFTKNGGGVGGRVEGSGWGGSGWM